MFQINSTENFHKYCHPESHTVNAIQRKLNLRTLIVIKQGEQCSDAVQTVKREIAVGDARLADRLRHFLFYVKQNIDLRARFIESYTCCQSVLCVL